MIDGMAQVIGLAWLPDGNRRVACLGHPGGGAGQIVAGLGCRIEARGRPELLMEAPILVLQAHELHDLDQGQRPGGHGKTNQQPDDGAFNGFEWGCQQAHDEVFLCTSMGAN